MSQCERVLAVLSDGREHEMREIHARAGFMRLNSRVSELRARGHNIECRKQGGEYHYRLVASLNAADPPEPRLPQTGADSESAALKDAQLVLV